RPADPWHTTRSVPGESVAASSVMRVLPGQQSLIENGRERLDQFVNLPLGNHEGRSEPQDVVAGRIDQEPPGQTIADDGACVDVQLHALEEAHSSDVPDHTVPILAV